MTDQEFELIRAELRRLATGLSKATEQIVAQEAEINALSKILERKNLASPYELEVARNQAAIELDEILQQPASGGPNRSKVVNMGRFQARRCRARF